MVPAFILASLLIPATAGQEITPLNDGWFRVTLVFDKTTAAGHAQAQISIIDAANAACRGKGRAVSEGTLELNNAPPIRKNRKALALSEVYRCVPKGG